MLLTACVMIWLCSDTDNCPSNANSDQLDADADAIGDVCDGCPADPLNDQDADGVCGCVASGTPRYCPSSS